MHYSQAQRTFNAPQTLFRLILVFLSIGICSVSSAQPEDSECLFEFNKAYATNESGIQQLDLAQQYVTENRYPDAAVQYQLAISLLQQSIDHYNKLPTLALDCSAANISIAQNNARLALENLEWAKTLNSGLDCVKAIDELESLSSLASKYYYEQRDPVAARNTINDALLMAAQIENDGICPGEYAELLNEQTRYAQTVANALQNRSRFDRCADSIKAADAAERLAQKAASVKNTSQARLNWQQVQKHAGDGLNAEVCDGLYLKRLQNLKINADRHLNN